MSSIITFSIDVQGRREIKIFHQDKNESIVNYVINGLTKNEMQTVHKSRAIFFSSDNPKLPLDSYCTFYHYTYFSRLSYNLSDFFFLLYMKKKFSFYWKMTPTTTLKDFTLCVSFYHAWTDFFRDLYYMVPIYGDMQCKVNFYWKIIVDLVFYEMFFWYSILNWY